MSTINPVLLYGPSGQPISTNRRFLHASGNTPAHEPWATVYEDIDKSIKPQDRHFVVSSARKLYANLGFVREAIDGKALASFGNAFLPRYIGKDAWGKTAQAWLRDEWCPAPEIRGGEFDWATLKFLESTNVDHSGDVGILLTYKGDPARPWPTLQMVPAHRIALRNATTREGEIQGDECAGAMNYKGRKYADGVIFGDHGDPVAFALIGETAEQDAIVSSRSLILIKEPALGSSRSLPAFFHGILECRSVMTTQEREAFAGVIGSSIALMEQNESGGPEGVPSANVDPTVATTTLDPSGSALQIQSYLGGLVRYFRAGSGANLQSFTSTRPGEAWESFQNRLIKMACAPVWPDELCWQMAKISGPGVRAVQGKARRFVTDRQALISAVSLREIQFALAIAIKTGRLPAPSSKTWAKDWDFVKPPKISIDDGRDGAAKLNDYFAGILNLSDLLEEDGRERDSHLYTRAWDIVAEEKIRREVSEEAGLEGWEIPPDRMHKAVGSAANNSAQQPAKTEEPKENQSAADDTDPENDPENENQDK